LALGVFCGWLVSLMNGVVAMTFLHHVGAICVNAAMWGFLEVARRLYRQDTAAELAKAALPADTCQGRLVSVSGAPGAA
ncbi:MAG: hypothetical protein K6U00_10865, partial [Armatimonadetes bacterium]|nr:hypothetical protein [Armatimonadota bacterium]